MGLNAPSMLFVAIGGVSALGPGPVLLLVFVLSCLHGTIRKSGWGICTSSGWVLFCVFELIGTVGFALYRRDLVL